MTNHLISRTNIGLLREASPYMVELTSLQGKKKKKNEMLKLETG